MKQSVGLCDDIEKLCSQSFAFKGSFDQSGKVENFDRYKPPAINTGGVPGPVNHPQLSTDAESVNLARCHIRFLGCEWIVRDFGSAGCCGVEESGLSSIGFSDESDTDQCERSVNVGWSY